MTIHAYVLVECDVAKARVVNEAVNVSQHPGVKVLSTETVIGPYDVIVELEAEDLDKLGDFITEGIQRIEGGRANDYSSRCKAWLRITLPEVLTEGGFLSSEPPLAILTNYF